MLKILTLNINAYATKHGPWSVRRNLIAQAIELSDPDIIALQAVRKEAFAENGSSQAEQLAALLGRYRFCLFQPAFTASESAEGLALMAKNAPEQIDYRALTLLPGLEDANSRVMVRTRFATSAGPLDLFNSHFSWVAEQTALNVAEAMSYARPDAGLALMLGDMNSTPDSAAMRQLAARGWSDAWEVLRPGDPGYTFEADAPSLRIDYGWASRALEKRLAGIDIVAAATHETGARASDHRGLLLTLDIG